MTGPDGCTPCGSASEGAVLSSDNPNHRPSAYRDRLVAHLLQPALEGFGEPVVWEVEMEAPTRLDPFRDSAPSCRVLARSSGPVPEPMQRFAFASMLTLNYADNPVLVRWLIGFLSGSDRSRGESESVREKLRLMSQMETGCSPYLASAHALAEGASSGDLTGGSARSAHRLTHDAPHDLDLSVFAAFACSATPERCAEVAGASVTPCRSWRLGPA